MDPVLATTLTIAVIVIVAIIVLFAIGYIIMALVIGRQATRIFRKAETKRSQISNRNRLVDFDDLLK